MASVWATWVRRIGKVAGVLGGLMLAFAAYQLWGTGVRTARAQDSLDIRFRQELAADAASNQPPPIPGTGTTPGTGPLGSSPPAPSATDRPATNRPLTTSFLPSGEDPADAQASHEPVGRIEIPKIGATFVIVEGTDVEALKLGPGHFPETPLPGQPGNAAIAGHRTTFLAPFNRIDELDPGDEIHVETRQGRFTYVVEAADDTGSGHRIVLPTQTEILDQRAGQNTLTLMACHPKGSAATRIVVVGRLVGEPAPFLVQDRPPAPPTTAIAPAASQSGGPGTVPRSVATSDVLLGGDGTFLRTIVWALIAGDLWLCAWFIARRRPAPPAWRPWLIYGLATIPFVVALFFTFEGINALLPVGF